MFALLNNGAPIGIRARPFKAFEIHLYSLFNKQKIYQSSLMNTFIRRTHTEMIEEYSLRKRQCSSEIFKVDMKVFQS